MSIVTLIDGQQIHEGYLADIERRVLADHIAAMWRLDTLGRREYLAGVERSQGRAWREAVANRFSAEWEARRAAQGGGQ